MPSDPLILGFDTSAAHCAAALLRGPELVASTAETMARGQAERLMPLVEELLARSEATWHDLDAIGVGVGPGNFTGIRISVSAARGLSLGLGIPAVGISGFESHSFSAPEGHIAAIPAPRDQVYVRAAESDPALLSRGQAELLGPLFCEESPAILAENIARIAATRWRQDISPPAPLYVRPADAAPSSDVPPVLLDG